MILSIARYFLSITAFTLCASAYAQDAVKPGAAPSTELPVPVPAANKISISQAVQIGLKDNPQTTASHFAVVSARENYNGQKSPVNPTVQYGALNNTVAPATVTDGLSQAANYTAYITVETSGAQKFRASQSKEQFHQAEFDAASLNLALKLNILTAYVNLETANRALEVEQTVYANLRQLAELTRKRFEAGAGNEADSIRANITAIQEEQNLIESVAAVNSARAVLNQQLGHPTDSPIDALTPLEFQPATIPSFSDLKAAAERRRPEVQSALANLKSLHASAGLARSAYYPDLVVGKDFTATGEVNIGFSVPIDLGSIKGSVRKAQADVRSQEAQVELARQAVDLDVKSSQISVLAAKRQVETYDNGILKQSERLFNQMKESYLLGGNSLLDVITAENTYRAVQSAYNSALGAYSVALYTLEHAVAAPLNAAPGTGLMISTASAAFGKQAAGK